MMKWSFWSNKGEMKLKIWENKGGPSYSSACCCNDLNCQRSRPPLSHYSTPSHSNNNLNLFPWQVCWISILIFFPPSPRGPASELGMIIQWWDLCWQFLLLELHPQLFSFIGIFTTSPVCEIKYIFVAIKDSCWWGTSAIRQIATK